MGHNNKLPHQLKHTDPPPSPEVDAVALPTVYYAIESQSSRDPSSGNNRKGSSA
jgi:hypothetical protein